MAMVPDQIIQCFDNWFPLPQKPVECYGYFPLYFAPEEEIFSESESEGEEDLGDTELRKAPSVKVNETI